MKARDRWAVNLGFDAGWDAHEAYVVTAPNPADPTDLRVPSFERVSDVTDDDHDVLMVTLRGTIDALQQTGDLTHAGARELRMALEGA